MGKGRKVRIIRWNTTIRVVLILPAALMLAAASRHVSAQQNERQNKVLMVGIDGCRFDAILYSQSRILKSRIKSGAWSDRCDVLDKKGTKADTASGSGWSTILTGVWADRHNVLGNDFKSNRLADCPSILKLASQSNPKLKCIALVTWPPIKEFICKSHSGCRLVVDGDKKGYKDGDRLMAEKAVKVLTQEDPDLLFLYFGHVDSVGHGYGFHPKSPKYTNGIEEVDSHLVKIFAALEKRKNYHNENWLVMFFTDHGGKGRSHGGGRTVPEMRAGFIILHGPSVQSGEIKRDISNVDIVPTALKHLKIQIDPKWRLEGKPILTDSD